MIRLDNGERYRERRKAPASSKSGALRWGQQRERYLLTHGPGPTPSPSCSDEPEIVEKKEVPTFGEFAPRFLDGHARANRHRPSTIEGTEKNLRVHVLPAFGSKRLDELTQEDIQRFKGQRTHLKNTTVNHALTVLRTMIKVAIEWGVIERSPVEIRQLKPIKTTMDFFDFDEFEALVDAAAKLDPRALLIVLLGGEAGLRSGEIRALEWESIDFRRRLLTVERSEYKGHVTLPKHDKIRQLPMTKRLTEALRRHRHQQGPRVLYETTVRCSPAIRSPGGSPPRAAKQTSATVRSLPASHLLLALGHARRAGSGDPGARRTRGSPDHAAIHASVACSSGRGNPLARTTRPDLRGRCWRSRRWRHRGYGFAVLIEAL